MSQQPQADALDAPEAEREQLVRALKAQVRELTSAANRLRATHGEQAGEAETLRARLAEANAELDRIHQSRHWRWMTRFWKARALVRELAREPYPAFRRWLRTVIPHALRYQALALIGARLQPPRRTPARPGLSAGQQAAFERLLDRLELPGAPADYLGAPGVLLDDREYDDLRTLLDCLPAEVEGLTPRILSASSLPAQPRPLPRLNLLFVCGEFPNPVTGGGGAVFDLIRAQSRDHDIYLCAWYQPDGDAEALRALQPYCQAIKLVSMEQLDSGQTGLPEWVAATRMDVAHYYWPRALRSFDPALARHHLFTHVECVSLRLRKDMALARPFGPAWRGRFRELVTALKLELVDTAALDARIVVTQVDGEFLGRLDPRGSYVVLGVPVDFEAAALPERAPEPNTLTFVGNYLHYPNADAAVFFCQKIFPLVRQVVPEARLYLVGANPSAAVRACHDNRHVVVTGQVPDVRPYIQRAVVCLAPLVSGAGMRTKVNHYSGQRRACVATTLAAVELPYTDGRDIWVANEPEEFAARVVQMLREPDLARQMGTAAYHTARAHFDLPLITERFYRLYHAVRGEAPPGPAGRLKEERHAG